MALSDEFRSIFKALKLPPLAKKTIATLHHLEDQWSHWRNCERRYTDANIPADQQAAYTAFLDNPDEVNQAALLATTSPKLVAARYALLRRAYADLRSKVSTEAGKVLRPFFERITTAMSAEHARRLDQAESVNYSKLRNPAVIEAQKACCYANSMCNRVSAASNGLGRNDSPLELARPLLEVSQSQKG